MAIKGFTAPNVAGQPGAAPAAPSSNPLKGHQFHRPQTPDFPDGFSGRCVLVGARYTRVKDKVIVTFKATETGRDYVWFVSVAGKAADVGYPKLKYMLATVLGADSEAEYDAFDPEGYFFSSLFGGSNPLTEQGITAVGRAVDVTVTRGQQMVDQKTDQPIARWFQELTFEHVDA